MTSPSTAGSSGPPPTAGAAGPTAPTADADVDEHPLRGPQRDARGVQPQRESSLEVAPLHDLAGKLDGGPRDLAAAERGRGLLVPWARGDR